METQKQNEGLVLNIFEKNTHSKEHWGHKFLFLPGMAILMLGLCIHIAYPLGKKIADKIYYSISDEDAKINKIKHISKLQFKQYLISLENKQNYYNEQLYQSYWKIKYIEQNGNDSHKTQSFYKLIDTLENSWEFFYQQDKNGVIYMYKNAQLNTFEDYYINGEKIGYQRFISNIEGENVDDYLKNQHIKNLNRIIDAQIENQKDYQNFLNINKKQYEEDKKIFLE